MVKKTITRYCPFKGKIYLFDDQLIDGLFFHADALLAAQFPAVSYTLMDLLLASVFAAALSVALFSSFNFSQILKGFSSFSRISCSFELLEALKNRRGVQDMSSFTILLLMRCRFVVIIC
jgi:hypothetical protein